MAKIATLAVTINRRGTLSRAGCEAIGVFGPDSGVLLINPLQIVDGNNTMDKYSTFAGILLWFSGAQKRKT